ncbi:zinc-binding alcohol dehydrogenase family protein [Pedobacter nutrimenti]|uniref:zinc-binding alcohol dehydrogenase family protein n=1 Tax=Pedobacter nutrimenti TaxID=1241337 RepID=UPI00292F6317|nr:zinc-binding alcohol dehydrogenase family protein [Pedobacter nutrimenti]
MKAIVLKHPGQFEAFTKAQPTAPGDEEVLLKIKNISICGTDLHAFNGKQPFFSYPRILGHEIAAEIVAIGKNVQHLKVGDSCTVEPYRNPIADQAVKKGKTNCGSKLTVLGVHEDGAMQEYITYLAANIHVTNGLPADQVSLVEPFAIGSHAVERAQLNPTDNLLVIGAGPIGLGIIAIARLEGVKIVVLDVNQNRLDFAKQKFPEIETLKLNDTITEDLEQLLDGDLPTVVFDATGNKTSMQNAFGYVAAGGTVVFVGLFVGEVTFDDPNFHRKEITLKASRSARAVDFKKVINLFKANLIDTTGYITHRIKFDDLITEFEKLYLPEENVIKAIIDF